MSSTNPSALYYGSVASGLVSVAADNMTVNDTLRVKNLIVNGATQTGGGTDLALTSLSVSGATTLAGTSATSLGVSGVTTLSGTAAINSGIVLHRTTVGSNYTVLASDAYINITAASVTLTFAGTATGQLVWLYSSFAVTVTAATGTTNNIAVNGRVVTTFTLPANVLCSMTCASTTNAWFANLCPIFYTSAPATNDILQFNGTYWVNSANLSTGTLATTGLATVNSLTCTNNAAAATLSTSGLATLNSITCTNNAGAATLSTTGLATLNSLTCTNNAAAATLSTTGLATLASSSVTAGLTVGGTSLLNGALQLHYNGVTLPYTALATDNYIVAANTGTLTLPATNPGLGWLCKVVNLFSSAITISNPTRNIYVNGVAGATYSLAAFSAMDFVCTNSTPNYAGG